MSFNVDKIITGTPLKAFRYEREKLKSDYTRENAANFAFTYKSAPLSFVLDNSEEIFSEVYCGLPFYENLMSTDRVGMNYLLDPTVFQEELDKVNNFIEKKKQQLYQGRAVSKIVEEKLAPFYSLAKSLENKVNEYEPLMKLFELIQGSDGGVEFLDELFDVLYEIQLDKSVLPEDSGSSKHINLQLSRVVEIVYSCPSPYAVIGIGMLIAQKWPEYSSLLVEYTDRATKPLTNIDAVSDATRIANIIQTLMEDKRVFDLIASTGNNALIGRWNFIRSVDIDRLIPDPDVSIHVPEVEAAPSFDGHNIAFTEEYMEHVTDSIVPAQYDTFRYRAAKLDALLDMMPNYDKLSDEQKTFYEETALLRDMYEGEAIFLEWEDSGKPNPLIEKHIMTSKEAAAKKASEEEEKKKNTPFSVLKKDNDQKVADQESEDEIVEKLNSMIETLEKMAPAKDGEAKKANDKVIDNARGLLTKAKGLAEKTGSDKIKALCGDLKDQILCLADVVLESYHESFAEDFGAFMEDGFKEDHESMNPDKKKDDSEDDDDEKKSASKPKFDMATKIQNKALDKAAKDEEKLAKRDEKIQKLKNAGNAVSQKPKRQIDETKSFLQKFDKWDEDRRKKFMLKPGFRHKIFKTFRNALMYGAVAQIKLAWVPFVALIHHCSKLKNNRIRNELAREYDAEIKICDEKIADANAQNDNKSKYELMRIKERLEAERTRVRVNSSYI